MDFYALERITKLGDWRELLGDKWGGPGHSAHELAEAWLPAKGLPALVAAALDQVTELQGIDPRRALIEYPVFLDTDRAPSVNDLMVHGRNRLNQLVVIAVEGKAAEPFGPMIREWVRDRGEKPTSGDRFAEDWSPSRERRLSFLNKALGTRFGLDDDVRYQLLHRTASVILEAEASGALLAAVVVHSFGAAQERDGNWADYCLFLRRMGVEEPERMKAQEAQPLSSDGRSATLRLFFAWVDQPFAAVSGIT